MSMNKQIIKLEQWMTNGGLTVVSKKEKMTIFKYKGYKFGILPYGTLGEVAVTISTQKGMNTFLSTNDGCLSTTLKIIDNFVPVVNIEHLY